MTEKTLSIDPDAADAALMGSLGLFWILAIWIGIMTLVMPLYVWGCYNHVRRHTSLLRALIDEVRASRAASLGSRPPPLPRR